jgi:broad specificity phosphatase PhoE
MRPLLSLLLILAGGSTLAAQDARTVVVVRHAERLSPTDQDSPLHDRGRARATELARVLRDANIKTILTSQFIRTRDTAAPIATEKGITPVVLPRERLDELVEKLRQIPPGTTALVVHHSDTVPAIVKKLGGAANSMSDEEYDRMLIVTLPTGQQPKASVLTLRYGAK